MSRRRRFIAHIGAHKTGTTAFQAWLRANRGAMLRAGYLVPGQTPRFGNHRTVVDALAGTSPRPRAAEIRAATLAEFADHPAADILVSTEVLSAEAGLAILPRLTAATEGFDRVAVLCVRDPIAHLNSGFAQLRKAMRNRRRSFRDYLEDALASGRADWRIPVTAYEAQGWRMVVLPYAAEAKAQGIIRFILSHPEFGDLARHVPLAPPAFGNPSLGAIGLILMDLIQERIELEVGGETRAPHALRERVAAIASARFADQPFNGFDEETRGRMLAHYQDTNRWIAERFWTVPWERACPPAAPALVSPQHLGDLPDRVATRVARAADRLTDFARALSTKRNG